MRGDGSGRGRVCRVCGKESNKKRRGREDKKEPGIRSQQETTWGCFDDFTGAF
jgi:hypothetical protein